MPISLERFALGMGLLQSRWPKQEIGPELSAAYAEYLADLTDDEFTIGVKRAVAELNFFPSAKEIKGFARPELPADVEAGAILTQILDDDEVKTYHPSAGAGLDLTKIGERYGMAAQMAVVAIGGVRRLARGVNDRDFPFVLDQFRDAYTGFAAEMRARGEVARLSGGSDTPAAIGSTSRLFPDLPRRRLQAPERVGDVLALPDDYRDRAAGDR